MDFFEKAVALSQVELDKEERARIARDVEHMLRYVEEVRKVSVATRPEALHVTRTNVFRDDVVTNERGKYTEAMIRQAPQSSAGYLVSNKVL